MFLRGSLSLVSTPALVLPISSLLLTSGTPTRHTQVEWSFPDQNEWFFPTPNRLLLHHQKE